MKVKDSSLLKVKVLVVRQPWAWLIVNGRKDIENRNWKTRYRGRLLIQASGRLPSKRELEKARRYARERGADPPEKLEVGGILGSVQLEDCVTSSRSRWFEGPVGWVLSKPKKLPFVRLKGRLRLFDPPRKVVQRLV